VQPSFNTRYQSFQTTQAIKTLSAKTYDFTLSILFDSSRYISCSFGVRLSHCIFVNLHNFVLVRYTA
jgi:hypothetical protein